MRYRGKVSRALAVLLIEGESPSTAILTTRCVTRFVRRWNARFSQQKEQKPVKLFELDRLKCPRVSIRKAFHKLVLDARGKTGTRFLWTLNLVDGQLDRIGTSIRIQVRLLMSTGLVRAGAIGIKSWVD